MKHRPCVLLVLSLGLVVAGQASAAEAPQASIGAITFSTPGPMTDAKSLLLSADSGQRAPSGIGLFAENIQFPVPVRPAVESAQKGATVRSAMGRAFHYEPSPYALPGAEAGSSGSSVTMMEPIHVPGSKIREISYAIDAAMEFRRAEAFHVTSGGRLASLSIGRYDIEFGAWKHEALIPEETHVGIPKLVVDLVHISW